MTFEERTIRSEEIYNGKLLKVEKHYVTLENGREAVREIVKHQGAVAVLAVKDDSVLLIRQFRKAMEEVLTEVPAGKVETGEVREVTAMRELEEETGLKAHQMTHVYDFYVSPGFCDELISLYLAEDLYESHELMPDEDEAIDLMWVKNKDIAELLRSGQIRDAKTIAALQYFLLNYNYSK